MNYLDTENAVELKVVTGVISKKVLGNPLEKYYVVDNKVRVCIKVCKKYFIRNMNSVMALSKTSEKPASTHALHELIYIF